MKFIAPAVVAYSLLCTPAFAISADIFGLSDREQACSFLQEAEDLARIDQGERFPCGPRTRSTRVVNEIQLLQEAYRADPEATLDLIERILKAGKTH